jgi:hypothetical protein
LRWWLHEGLGGWPLGRKGTHVDQYFRQQNKYSAHLFQTIQGQQCRGNAVRTASADAYESWSNLVSVSYCHNRKYISKEQFAPR